MKKVAYLIITTLSFAAGVLSQSTTGKSNDDKLLVEKNSSTEQSLILNSCIIQTKSPKLHYAFGL